MNPEKLHLDEDAELVETAIQATKKIARLISIDMIEEFARIMDDSIDTDAIETLAFLKRIPFGIYRFSINPSPEADETIPRNYEVLLYDDTEEAYDDFVNDLETLFKLVNIGDREILTDTELEALLQTAKEIYFPDYQVLLGYRDADVKNMIRFYAQKQIKPEFLAFTERKKCDISLLARHIRAQKMDEETRETYVDSLWNSEKSFWQILFGYDLRCFWKQIEIELHKLRGLYGTPPLPPTVKPDEVPLEALSLDEIKEYDPFEYRRIKDAVFARQTDSATGFITCAASGVKSQMRRGFQIDHIKPMCQGGLTTIENLQILSRKAHTEKTRLESLQRQSKVDRK